MTLELKFGCDPEGFVQNGEGQFVSAHGLFPGTKHEPFKVDKGAVQVDGLALEFNIDPVETEEDFLKNIKTVRAQMDEMVKDIDPSWKLVFTPFARFDPVYFVNLPDQSKVLGCDPDYDLTGTPKSPTSDMMYEPARAAGGHIHIGWTKDEDPLAPHHFADCLNVAKTIPFSAKYRAEKERIKFYGQPGSFRPKPYGVELRSPSNMWVANERTQSSVFRYVSQKMNSLVQ